jgi:hypothetical protein
MAWLRGLALGLLWAVPTGAAEVGPLLQWTDHATDETEFQVERAPYGGAYGSLATVGPNVTEYRDTAATPGERYCWRVRAANPTGASTYAEPVCARVLIPTETGVTP